MSAQTPSPIGSLRISFVRAEKDLSVIAATFVQKRAPAGDLKRDSRAEQANGLWLELHHPKGVVYSRLVTAQLDAAPEVFTGSSDQPIIRSQAGERQNIDILVPLPAAVRPEELRLVVVEHCGRESRELVDQQLVDIPGLERLVDGDTSKPGSGPRRPSGRGTRP
jgi:hypothetical protein